MNVISYGGGTNSTAMIIGMIERDIPIDIILFADTGGEKPETYAYVALFDKWIREKGYCGIATLEYTDEDGNRLNLEMECLRSKTLPSLAYGYKKCSLKHKRSVQDKFCNNNEQCRAYWKTGKKVNKFIGFDADEWQRIDNAKEADEADKKYSYHYPLYEWGWGRDECVEAIKRAGLPLPGKSSCFFCPSMKLHEIVELRDRHPELFQRALAIEENAKDGLITIEGLGRYWSWKDYINAFDNQVHLCGFFDAINEPCGCYDGQ